MPADVTQPARRPKRQPLGIAQRQGLLGLARTGLELVGERPHVARWLAAKLPDVLSLVVADRIVAAAEQQLQLERRGAAIAALGNDMAAGIEREIAAANARQAA